MSYAAHAANVEDFKAEDWDGSAFTDDTTGQFSHCAVYASYRNGSTLYISYEVSESWYLSVSNDSWQLTAGDSYPIKFKIDRRGEIEGTGDALATGQIGLPIENDHPFIDQLRHGNQLTISFQDSDYAFELSNSNKAMTAAQDCVRRHVLADTHSTPIGSSEQAVASASGQEATQAPTGSESDSAASQSDNVVASADEQTFGPWVVAPTNDSAGAFVNCTAYGMQGEDQLILSYFPDGIWTFGLYRAAWNLDTSQKYNFSYNVDAEANVEGVTARTVEVPEPTRIFFEVSRTDNIMNRIEAGRTLYIRLGGPAGLVETYNYPLDEAHAAFTAARKCASEHAPTVEPPAVVEDTGTPEEPVVATSASPTETETPTSDPLGTLDAQSLGRRVALVIGNSDYGAVGTLPNATRDANALAEALRQLGFASVTLLTDLSKGAMERALIDFADEAQGADWALVYFGGHGLEMEGENYLVPVDAELKQDRHVKLEAVSLDEVLDTVRGAKTLQLVILDACRDNPFLQQMTRTLSTRSVSRGLARIEPTGAELVVYAARDGQVAMDGDGENSPLVAALLQHLEEPGVEINLLFRKVRDSVMAATNNAQQPFTYGSLPGTELYFVPPR